MHAACGSYALHGGSITGEFANRAGQPQLYLPNISSEGVESVYEVVKVSGGARRTWFIGEDDIQCAYSDDISTRGLGEGLGIVLRPLD